MTVTDRYTPTVKYCQHTNGLGKQTCGQAIFESETYCDRHNPRPVSVPKRHRRKAYGGAWAKQRLRVLKRDNYQCQIRGPGCLGYADQVDHIHPLMYGGPLHVSDSELQAACSHCNASSGAAHGNSAR